jgi:hypothetical protein
MHNPLIRSAHFLEGRMNRARFVSCATFVSSLLLAGSLFAQGAQAPPMQSVLAGKKIVPPLKGQAEVEFTSSKPNREKDNVVTKFQVKNISNAPIARLEIDETWYDKGGSVITGGRGVLKELLQPGEVQTLTIETPYKAGMTSNNYNFKHVNGTVKPKRVPKLEGVPTTTTSKQPAAKPATTTKK